MAKKKSRKKREQTSLGRGPAKESLAVDAADGMRFSENTQGKETAGEFVEVGKNVVPGMRLRCICRGHTGTIGRIAWSPCGRFIASPSEDKTIRIWDANDGNCVAVLERHQSGVTCVDWAPNGDGFASGAQDENIVLWD